MPGLWAYFDTSVLVKRYVQEEGSSRARSLLRKHRILTSAIAPTEAISALSRRRMLEELTAKHFSETYGRIKADRAYWELVEVSALVLQGGGGGHCKNRSPNVGCHSSCLGADLSKPLMGFRFHSSPVIANNGRPQCTLG